MQKNEVLELEKKAEHGDSSAMVDLGVHYIENGNLGKAHEWWEKAANLGQTGAMQNYLMTNFNPNLGKPDASKCVDLLKRFVNKNGWATAILGAVYCGSEHVMLMNVFGEGSFSIFKNPNEGYRLIEHDCVKNAESNFDYYDYDAISRAYYPVDSTGKGPEQSEITVPKLQKALEYLIKSRERGIVPPNYEEVHTAQIEIFKKQIAARQ